MSRKTDPTEELITRSKMPTLKNAEVNGPQHAKEKPSQVFSAAGEDPRRGGFMRSILRELSAGREHRDDKSFKDFTHLTRSLEKLFSTAETVDQQTGNHELRQAGLRRVAIELHKRFKKLDMPAQRASYFSRALTETMGRKGVEQISFSLTSSDGHPITNQATNSFQLSATRVHSHDISLNLRTGGCSLKRTQFENLAARRQNTPQAGFGSATGVQAPRVTPPATDSRNSLREISRVVQHSAVMKLSLTTPGLEAEGTTDAPFEDGLDSLQQLVADLKGLTEQSGSLFNLHVQIRNLRIEQEANDNHLRFSVGALAPVGLIAIDESGLGTTLYPRLDGRVGKFLNTDSNTTA